MKERGFNQNESSNKCVELYVEETRGVEIAVVMKNERWFSKSADLLDSRARGSAMAPSLSCSPS